MATAACRVRGCGFSRQSSHLVCGRCWSLVPPAVQTKVVRLYQSGAAYQPAEYYAAARAAVEFVYSERNSPRERI